LAWRYGGECPYRLFNSLDENYVPLGGGEAKPPPRPGRLRSFKYGMALYAQEFELTLHDKKKATRK
jgi:hypothetical protein